MNTSASTAIKLRTCAIHSDLIDRAAHLHGKSRSEFMLEASREKAQQVLLDQTQFTVTPKRHSAFVALMPAPLKENAALQRLLAKQAPGEKGASPRQARRCQSAPTTKLRPPAADTNR